MSLLSVLEPLATEAVEAMAPEVQKLFKSLKAGTVASAPNSGAEVALAANVTKAMPAVTPTVFNDFKKEVGIAVAQFAISNPGVNVSTDASFASIQALALTGMAKEGIDVSKIPSNSLKSLVSMGIEMYLAGVGTKYAAV
jgi:hypothetical protein